MAIDRIMTLEEAANESGTKLEYMEEVCKEHGIDVMDCWIKDGDKFKGILLSDYVAVFGW